METNEILNILPQHYQVNVVVIEGRLLALSHTYGKIKIYISIGKKRKIIRAKSSKTDSPFFNDFCSFHYNLPLNVLLDQILVVKVYQISGLIKKFIGSFKVELTTVWNQPNHQFYHKWAVLGDLRKEKEGARGFLKCDISILSQGKDLQIPDSDDLENEDVIEENLMVPFGGIKDRHRARIIFSIFRADSFSPRFKDKLASQSILPYVKITYAGSVLKTSVAKSKGVFVWNEELTFSDLIPPLCQNILVEMCDRQNAFNKHSIGNTNIEMSSLCEEGTKGFLPTFGPSFLYLYNPLKKFDKHRNGSCVQKNFTYSCRLLIAMRTEVLNYAEDVLARKKKKKKKKILKPQIKTIPPLLESTYFDYKKFILFGVVFDVFFFDKKQIERNIKIRLTIGPKRDMGERLSKEGKRECADLYAEICPNLFANTEPEDPDPNSIDNPKTISLMTKCNTTRNQTARVKRDYSFIKFSGKFPCAHVYGEWPDALRKMYRTNVIKKVILQTAKEVNKLKSRLDYEEERKLEYSSEKLKDILLNLSKSCELLLLMTKMLKVEDTNLSRQKKKFYHQEITEMAEKARLASSKSVLVAEDEVTKIAAYLGRLTKYAQDPENSFPDTEIWILRNKQITGHIRLKTEDIVYSSNCPERGIKSGKIQTIFLRGKKEKIKAKIDIFLWFGLANDFVECLNMLPQGYKEKHRGCRARVGIKIPTALVYKEKHYFTCRVHIFQAKLLIGFDETGLADPFTRVIVFEQTKTTKVKKKTLSPIWNETLIFPVVILYGPSKNIKKNSITIIAEVYDREKATVRELIGRCFIIPVVKLLDDKYEPPEFPPKLKWEDIKNEIFEVGKILMVSELLELKNSRDKQYIDHPKNRMPLGMPDDIVPHNEPYRLEIMFWGVRQFKRRSNLKNKVFVILECAGKSVKSPILKNVRHKLNFPGIVQVIDLNIPEEREYAPPLTVKLYHVTSVTRSKNYVANCIVSNIKYFQQARLEQKKKEKELHVKIVEEKKKEIEEKKVLKINKKFLLEKLEQRRELKEYIFILFSTIMKKLKCVFKKKCEEDFSYEAEPIDDDEPVDWWVKYYASQEPPDSYPGVPHLKIYKEELEAQPQFKGFSDFLYTFEMTIGHGKKEQPVVMAKVKAILDLYRVSDVSNKLNGHLDRAPTNEPVKYIVRAYIVCGINLPAKDIYGKSDPYIQVILGDQKKSDRKNYVPKQLNPTFGKCFEFTGTFPFETLLRVKIIDYDATSKDDLIGETIIDLENRYYSKYHASCGLSTTFEKDGTNPWRDIFMPKDILKKTCRMFQLKQPIYERDKVIVGDHTFHTKVPKKKRYAEQIQALEVLHRWYEIPGYGFHFVPEHVETRSLYNPAIPGIEQGKLHMWVDIFPADMRFMPPKVDILPREPMPLELRAIVWNVDDVVLDDRTFFFNEKMSDIYVKGWILSLEEDMQKTDIHYRSLNGEGSFNWRFIFHFNYIPTERKMVVTKKIDAFDLHPEEKKHQCKLEIQIWDNDAFGDDYLGTLILELSAMPRGAKLSSRCSLKMLAPNAAKVNLFKIRKTRGWWPFRRLKEKQDVGSEFELSGKIDLELEILTEGEASVNPAGKGREEPNGLPPPVRPETSFNWLLSPLKTLRFIIWRKFARLLIWGGVILVLVFFVLMTLYLIPSMILQKILHII